MKYIIGLDLGVNNVGYSVIDADTEKIIKKGVRLYSVADKAQDRRIFRNSRRRIKRKNNRISECLNLFAQIDFPIKNTIDANLLMKRVKGLHEKLDKQDIVNIVCYFMSHRGYIPFGDEERDLVELKNMYPCEYYVDALEKYGKFRNLQLVIKHDDLKKELIDILNKQINFYPELKEIVNSERGLLWIFSRKRKFWEGPGSIESLTPYGRFKTNEDVLEYKQLQKEGKEKYLFEELIGNCKIFTKEKCVPKANYFAEKFNLLNDFINIKINNIENIKNNEYIYLDSNKSYRLTTTALEAIIDYCINSTGTITYVKVLKEVLGLKKTDISGYRYDKNSKPLFSLMNSYRYIKKMYDENSLDFNWLIENNYSNYNILINLLAVAPGITEITKMLNNIHECSEKELNVIKQISDKLKKDQKLQYCSLSEKALVMATNDMITNCMNFMQVYKKFDYEKEYRTQIINEYGQGQSRLLMTTKYVDDIVASPQVKKTLRQAINIVNKIIKEQGEYPSVIAVESTAEINSDEQRKEIEKNQKQNEERRNEAIKYLEQHVSNEKITPKMVERVMLYRELDEMCPYCGKHLNINDVLNDIVEIEHILPISQSADDSQDNKTLACVNCNHTKGNRTPYEFLTPENYEAFVDRIIKLKISDKKKENFLTTEDINKYKIKFFNRNLRDTAYATKEMIQQIKLFNLYLQENAKDIKILTLSTPGQLTHKIREDWHFEKDRTEKYHHAVDASIVAGIATTYVGQKIIKLQNDPQYLVLNKNELNEIPTLLRNFSMPKIKEEVSHIHSDADVDISMQVNKDINRSISNANIKKFINKNNEYYIINQVDDIYAPELYRNDKKLLDSLFDENDTKNMLLCQENDPNLFHYLKEIYDKYKNDNTNPFLNYCYEKMDKDPKEFNYLFDGIKTPSKNNKGVLIKRLRYMQSVNDPYLLDKKNINKKQNTLIGLDSVAVYCTSLYWDKDLKKIIFMPIYVPCVDFKTKKINKEHKLYQLYYQRLLAGKNVEFIVDLYNGNYIKIEKPNGDILYEYVKGYHKSNASIQCKSGKYLSPKDKFTLYDVDVLGNKHKRLTWPPK